MNTSMALSVYTEMHCLLPKSLFGQEYNYYNYMIVYTHKSEYFWMLASKIYNKLVP